MAIFSTSFIRTLLLCVISASLFSLASCYSIKWSAANFSNENTPSASLSTAPPAIRSIFKKHPKGVITLPVLSPGLAYNYDISEKDKFFDNKDKKLVFNKVTLELASEMPQGQILTDVYFWDAHNNYLRLGQVDLLRIIPKLETTGTLQYAEYLMEEFSRFGVTFRKEHKEFQLVGRSDEPALQQAISRAYRADLTNNCLDATKWEIQLIAEDYSDTKARTKSPLNYNQDRMLSHGWFYIDQPLYTALLELKNPKTVDAKLFSMPYDDLSKKGESVVVDFAQLRRPLRNALKTTVIELGHQKNLPIKPIDTETGYKRSMGLLGKDTLLTYQTVLEKPLPLAKFDKEGFYDPADPRVYNLGFLKQNDDIQVSVVDVPNSDCHVELKIGGKDAYYTFTIGNLDMSTMEEQRLYGINVGVNLYPKSRRYNPVQSSLTFDTDLTPLDQQPYFLMTETASGKWVNNQFKGVEKAYIGYSSLLGNTIDVYLLSYEREMPVWYARVKLTGAMREKIRGRRGLYNY
jgi:hypothetical protein